ncbi:hypothetical protein NDU88_005929 [Pleurodeles waltl]|uniref:Uncharacterized protein n=1 Tax=Pleurodeles waltl TaxID=8319 RepID=A0AAV7LQG1_PLEWA|nr:hypothetical protein NDU88_005929 [Pleurodeles waltl]
MQLVTMWRKKVSFLPFDDQFCEAMDASIQQAISLAWTGLEKKIGKLAEEQRNNNKVQRQAPKCPADQGINKDAFSCVKKAFLQANLRGQALEHLVPPPSSSLEMMSISTIRTQALPGVDILQQMQLLLRLSLWLLGLPSSRNAG